MSYERPQHQQRPDKQRRSGIGGKRNNRTDGLVFVKQDPIVMVPYSAVLFPNSRGYTGAAHVGVDQSEENKAQYLGWLKILRDAGSWREWIVPIERMTKKTRKVTVGEAYQVEHQNGSVVRENREFGEDFRRDLNVLVELMHKSVSSSALSERMVTPEVIAELKKSFPAECLAKAKEGAKVVQLESIVFLSSRYATLH